MNYAGFMNIITTPMSSDNENVTAMLGKNDELIREPIACSYIEARHHIPTRYSGKSNIIMKFHSRLKRETLIQTTKRKRLSISNLGFSGIGLIFNNDHFCPSLKSLFRMASSRKRQSGWLRNGKLFPTSISSSSPLLQILSRSRFFPLFTKKRSGGFSIRLSI